MKNFFPVIISLTFITVLSCSKEELLEEEPIRPFQVDTLYYTSPGFDNFSLTHRSFGEPVITDSSIYSLVRINGNNKMAKFNLSTGEMLWQSSMPLPDWDYPRHPVLSHGKIAFRTSNFVYLIDAVTGNTLHTYSPPAGYRLRGATIHADQLFVSIHQDKSARLEQMALDGSQRKLLLQVGGVNGQDALPGSVHVISSETEDLLVWAVADKSTFPNTSIYYGLVGFTSGHQSFSLGSSNSGGYGPLYLVKSQEEGTVFLLAPGNLLAKINLKHHYPLNWVTKTNATQVLQNGTHLYAHSKNRLAMHGKNSGSKEQEIRSYSAYAATDQIVIGNNINRLNGGITIYDPLSLQPLFTKDGAYLSELYEVGRNEFFFSSQERVGKIRITPL